MIDGASVVNVYDSVLRQNGGPTRLSFPSVY
jgi:hypothetical protein